MAKLVRTDKNGTQYWEDDKCQKCNGTGYIEYFNYVDGGICYDCNGTGHRHTHWKVYTPEYSAKLEARRIARLKAGAEKRNAAMLEKVGFANGSIKVVLGDTYAIREQLKAEGGKYHPVFGWYFTDTDRDSVEVTVDEIFEADEYGDLDLVSDARAIIECKKAEARPSASKHLHEVGDKVAAELTLVRVATYETHFTYYGELNYVYTFEDADGNQYVWKTGKGLDAEEGDELYVSGTVKENGEYMGAKQTVLTRCRVS